MGGIASTLALCGGYCAYQTVSSLCNTCFGNTDSPSHGRKRSVLLLAMSIALSLAFQYSVAPALYKNTQALSFLPYVGSHLVSAWNDGCDYTNEGLQQKCMGNAGVYRVASSSVLFFVCAAMASKLRPNMNREAWPAKYSLYLLLVLSSCFVSNSPLFLNIFQPVAWIGGAVFIVIQQLILVDLAYNWNESWVELSNQAELEQFGSGTKFLHSILITCALLYGVVITGIVLLYQSFSGCPTNEAIISITLALIIIVTAIQLSGEEGSLLTSAVISIYAVYLAFSAVSKNPNATCNPRLEQNDIVGIILGIGLTFVSLAWTGWSWTAEERLSSANMKKPGAVNPAASHNEEYGFDIDLPFLDDERSASTGGVVLEGQDESDSDGHRNSAGANIWKLNVVLALISCWIAVSLTGWGSIYSGDDIANPQVNKANLWVIVVCQWLALGLYAWTLVAPRLFPHRDFS